MGLTASLVSDMPPLLIKLLVTNPYSLIFFLIIFLTSPSSVILTLLILKYGLGTTRSILHFQHRTSVTVNLFKEPQNLHDLTLGSGLYSMHNCVPSLLVRGCKTWSQIYNLLHVLQSSRIVSGL